MRVSRCFRPQAGGAKPANYETDLANLIKDLRVDLKASGVASARSIAHTRFVIRLHVADKTPLLLSLPNIAVPCTRSWRGGKKEGLWRVVGVGSIAS
jgi:hypothetical protein